MRPIDADKLDVITYSKNDIDGYADTFDDGVRWLAEQIDKAETILPEQEATGEWIYEGIQDVSKGHYKAFSCSNCGCTFDAIWYKYCPNCGRKNETHSYRKLQ